MTHWYEEFGEFDEIPDEYPEEISDEYLKEQDPELIDHIEMDIPDVWWAESIKEIENPEIREKEIETAKKILEKEKNLEEKLESGEFSQSRFDHENLVVLGREKVKFSTRCDLESIDLSYDKIINAADEFGLITAEAAGNPKPARMKELLTESIDIIGPDASQELADRRLEEEKMSDDTHETISRQVRSYKK
jgi:hypothetical protein